MAITPLQLVAPQQIASSATIYYTSTATKTRIDKVTVTNPTASAVQVTFYIVPSGGSVGDSTTITKTYSVPGLFTWNCPDLVGQIMAVGDTFRALASSATALTLMASGTQIS